MSKGKKLFSIILALSLVFSLGTGVISGDGNDLQGGTGLNDSISRSVDVLPGAYEIAVTGGTANPTHANPGDIVTVTLDPLQTPAGKRFMIWQLAKIVEYDVPAGIQLQNQGTLGRIDNKILQAAGVDMFAAQSPFVDGTTLSSEVIKFIMPAETRTLNTSGNNNPNIAIDNYPDGKLHVSALYDTIAQPTDESYAIWETSKWLFEETGVRLRGTPNERKAAAGLAEMLRGYGYTDVTHHQHPFYNASNVPSGTGPTAGRVVFSAASRLGDMHGSANPNNANFGTVTGEIVDLGTWISGVADLDAPSTVTGDVIAAVRFFPAASAANLNTIKSTVEAANPGLNIRGFLWTRSGGTYVNQMVPPASVGLAGNLPNITMPLHNLERVVKNKAAFESMQWHSGIIAGSTASTTNTVVAKKPASTPNPDLIIVVTAHMDTVLNATGASDNGSGVSVVMGLAKYFADKDLGNVEVWFCPNGSEEGNSMSGVRHIIHHVMTAEQRTKAININFDMVGTPSWFSGTEWGAAGSPLDAITIDPDPQWRTNANQGYPNSLSLPTYLVSAEGSNIPWAPGINNVRINHVGGVDGGRFAEAGIDTVNLLVVTNYDDALEVEYHRGGDNFYDNLSYDRMVMVFNLAKKGIEKAVAENVSKTAEFEIDAAKQKIILKDAAKHFKTFDRIEATIGPVATGTKLVFAHDDPTPGVKDIPAGFSSLADISLILAFGTGIADHADPVRNTSLGQAPASNRNAIGMAGVSLPLNTLLTRLYPAVSFTLNANGGTGSIAPVGSIDIGKTVVLPPNGFTRANHAFAGWNTAANGTGTAYADGATITLTNSFTLYAQWTRTAVGIGPGPILIPSW